MRERERNREKNIETKQRQDACNLLKNKSICDTLHRDKTRQKFVFAAEGSRENSLVELTASVNGVDEFVLLLVGDGV